MIAENESKKQYWFHPHEGYQSRCLRRIVDDLGVDEDTAETIVRLRSQIIKLQAENQRLETELAIHNTNQQIRLARYREVYYDVTWIELDFQD